MNELSGEYDHWFVIQLKSLLDALIGQGELEAARKEVERGIQYGDQNPGQVSSALLVIGRTALSAQEAMIPEARPQMGTPSLDFSELSQAVVSRKKGRIKKTLRGSLDDLKDV